jgi:hypothetical protein
MWLAVASSGLLLVIALLLRETGPAAILAIYHRLDQAHRNRRTASIRQKLYRASSPGKEGAPAVLGNSRNLNRCNLPVVLGRSDRYSIHCGFR